jgi:hypothetical protein
MSTAPLPQLPPLYYLDNFRAVLDWVRERYSDMLSADETAFITCFSTLATPSQALLVRLIMRKGEHFRGSKLTYSEIGDTAHAAEPLCALGWLHTDAPMNLSTVFSLLRKDEILTQLDVAKASGSLGRTARSKAALLDVLTALEPDSEEPRRQPFRCWCPDSTEPLYSLTVNALCDRLRLMFFGNLNQTWAEFVLADLGIFRYEVVNIAAESRGFRCREDVDYYLHLHQCREAFEAGLPIPEVLKLIDVPASSNPYLRERHGKLMFRLARQLEREGACDMAFELYCACAYTGARQRRIRILESQGRYSECRALATQAQCNPESDTELQLVERALHRLNRKLGLPAERRAAEQPAGRLDLLLPRPIHGSVERTVCEHLATPEAPVYYVENALISSLFGLLCWNAIFAPVPGAFFHPFHSGPVDLYSSDFRQRRADLFDECLGYLQTGGYKEIIRTHYVSKFGIQSPFVYWGLSQEILDLALHCLPPEHLHRWFDRLLRDIRANRAGMPDLIQFWPQEKRYRMIEVKGPGDRLQDNQRRWIAFCARHGMPVEVCHVQWLDA